MSVSAPATSPPVQDSAVADFQPARAADIEYGGGGGQQFLVHRHRLTQCHGSRTVAVA